MESTPVGRVTAPNGTFGSWARNTESQPSLLPGLCQTLQQILPNVRGELPIRPRIGLLCNVLYLEDLSGTS